MLLLVHRKSLGLIPRAHSRSLGSQNLNQNPGKERRQSVLSAARSSVSVTCSDTPTPFRSLSLSLLPSSLSLCLSSPQSSSLSLETWRLGNPPPPPPTNMCFFFFLLRREPPAFSRLPEASVTALSTRVDMALAVAVFHPEQKLSWHSEKQLYSSVSFQMQRKEGELRGRLGQAVLLDENDCILKAWLRLF